MVVILVFVIGFLVGNIFKKKDVIFGISSKLTDISLYLLLAVLGITIGSNEKIISNIMNIGFQSLAFAVVSILGSILCIIPLYLVFKKGKLDER